MARLTWSEQAIEDLLEIAEFIASNSPKYAKIQVRRIRERARILDKFPDSGRIVPELQNDLLREIILGNYRIIYEISDDVISILTIHHSARRLNL